MTAALLGLLTRIRLPGYTVDLEREARQQYLFPLVGVVVGVMVAAAAAGLAYFLEGGSSLLSGALLLLALYYITGILHIEGLSDFADGMMAHGTRERKRQVMKDVHSGVAGVISVVMLLMVLWALASDACARGLDVVEGTLLPWGTLVVTGMIIAEVGGKLAMNFAMYIGPSAHEGMGSLFVSSATAPRLAAAVTISVIVSALLVGAYFPLVMLGGVAGTMVALTARKHFGGVSGDAFGAANELGRLLVLLGWVLVV
jgi:adenosylcobinamide-GDP ribazoletransferase